MITGFNTDIEVQGVTYHVQTEDKGVNTPLILSLVYDRGTILASKRSPYDDLLGDTFDEKALVERLQKQHKLICAAVRAGRIEDLKRMTMKESALRNKGLVTQKEVKPVVEKIAEKINDRQQKTEEIPLPQFPAEELQIPVKPPEIRVEPPKAEPVFTSEIPKPKDELVWDIPISVLEEPIFEAAQIIEEEMILPAEAVEIITDFAKFEQVVDDSLKIELLSDPSFKGGERKTISILVRRGNQEKGLSGAHIMVKVIGTAFRPLIFHAKTDSNGIAIVHLQLPHFAAGRAAILVRAMSEGEEVEVRRVIQQG